MSERIHPRVPAVMRVQFRNASSFLFAYSVNLSRGGVFLETTAEIAVGAAITLELEVEGGALSLAGQVTWRRERPDADGPVGIGVEFDGMIDSLGVLIDELVADFSGITILLVCQGRKDRTTLTRQLRSIIAAAEVVGASDLAVAKSLIDETTDLVVIDGDTDTNTCLDLIDTAQALASPVPCIFMSEASDIRDTARELGASDVISNPPAFGELHSAVMRALGRPAKVAPK